MKAEHIIHTTHIIHEPLFTFAWDRADGVNLILFSDDGEKILAIKNGNDFDILRGCVDWDDDSLEDTARREAKDQANVTLDAVTICAVLSTPGELLSEVTYELVMTAFVTRKDPRNKWQEIENSFIDKEAFLASYASGNREEMKILIGMAEDYRVRRSMGKGKSFQTQLFQTAQRGNT